MNIYPSCLVAGHFAHRDRCSWTSMCGPTQQAGIHHHQNMLPRQQGLRGGYFPDVLPRKHVNQPYNMYTPTVKICTGSVMISLSDSTAEWSPPTYIILFLHSFQNYHLPCIHTCTCIVSDRSPPDTLFLAWCHHSMSWQHAQLWINQLSQDGYQSSISVGSDVSQYCKIMIFCLKASQGTTRMNGCIYMYTHPHTMSVWLWSTHTGTPCWYSENTAGVVLDTSISENCSRAWSVACVGSFCVASSQSLTLVRWQNLAFKSAICLYFFAIKCMSFMVVSLDCNFCSSNFCVASSRGNKLWNCVDLRFGRQLFLWQ